jgi:hypothetical protein
VAEWSIAPVLKTGNGQPFVSSNLTASASAATDFLSAPWHKVPANFTIEHTDFGVMMGAAQASMIGDPHYHQNLFGPLIETLARSIPEQVRSVDGEYQTFRLDIPQEPLCVSTIVMETEDGSLVPMVSG